MTDTYLKAQGYAETVNERLVGALSIEAPVFDATQKVIGSIICLIPISDYEMEKEDMMIQLVIQNAKEISSLQGFKG